MEDNELFDRRGVCHGITGHALLRASTGGTDMDLELQGKRALVTGSS